MSESTDDESVMSMLSIVSLTAPGQIQLQFPEYLRGPGNPEPESSGFQDSIDRRRWEGRDCVRTERKRGSSKSPSSPDRFIPSREAVEPPSTPFRIGKNPQELSPEEKLLRRRSPKEDPFMPKRTKRPTTVTTTTRRIYSPHYGTHLGNDSGSPTEIDRRGNRDVARQVSIGAIWGVGGASPALGRRSAAIIAGSRSLLTSGTTAPMYTAKFLPQGRSSREDREKYRSRVAMALDIDPTRRVFHNFDVSLLLDTLPSPSSPSYDQLSPLVWKDNAWRRAGQDQWKTMNADKNNHIIVPNHPFRTLDAPLLRDDFYCSTLAYSTIAGTLAVGLAHRVYLWSEAFGVQHPPLDEQDPSNYVTSLSFSSDCGGKSILAIGRKSGMLSLWSTFDFDVRFEISHSDTITCVAFKQTKSRRLSEKFEGLEVDTEDLAIGDDLGNIWYYSVEWPVEEVRQRFRWNGAVTLLAKISAHTQQVCGIAWSPDGLYMATGGNDNVCLLFELHDIIPSRELGVSSNAYSPRQDCNPEDMEYQDSFSCFAANASRRLFNKRHLLGHLLPSLTAPRTRSLSAPLPSVFSQDGSIISKGERTAFIPSNRQKHKLVHSAAVKAIAFAPWQPSLLATGGGSNDRAIHFYHTPSGACLATINVYAQVTSLIWSRTRREIVATFGFAQPEHPFRIAVFAWPSCEQIAAIPWGPHGGSWDSPTDNTLVDCGRALCAVSYPGRLPSYLYETPEVLDEPSTATPAIRARLTGQDQTRPAQRLVERVVVKPRAKEGGLWCSRTVQEGCIIVASSDQSVKFHEVWSVSKGRKTSAAGPYGGSEILEGLEGLENPGPDIIH